MTARRVPLYLGEGPDRKKIGMAEIDGPIFTAVIDDQFLAGELKIHAGDYSIGVHPEFFTMDPIPVVDASERDLKNPKYKEK